MTDNLSPTERTRRAIAAARTSRVPVDANGRPTAEPNTYIYEDGRLVQIDPARKHE